MQTHPPIPGYAFPTRLESPHRFLAAGSGWCFSNQSWVCSCSFDFLACIKAQSPFGLAFTWSTGRRSEEHTSELQSLMRISYAVFCLKKKKKIHTHINTMNQL